MTHRLLRGPSRSYWGENSLKNIAGELRRAGCTRPMVICSRTIARSPLLLDAVDRAADGRVVGIFDGVLPQSPLTAVRAAADAVQEFQADAIITVGGGSVMVTGRAANILHAEGPNISQHATTYGTDGTINSPRLLHPKLPMLAVPTTPTTATGKAVCAVTAEGHSGRFAMYDPKTRAQAVFLSPTFLTSCPPGLAANAGMNTLVMAVEGLLSSTSNFFSDAVLVHAVHRSLQLLPRLAAAPDDPDVHVGLALAALLTGEGTDVAGGGITAALSHTIGWQYGQPNGLVDAIVLPHRINHDVARHPAVVSKVVDLMGLSVSGLQGLLAAAFGSLGVPASLREIGVKHDSLTAIAREAMSDFAVRSDPSVQEADVLTVLEAAW